jgi:hypothetical protein
MTNVWTYREILRTEVGSGRESLYDVEAPDYDEAMTASDDAYYDKYASYYARYGW